MKIIAAKISQRAERAFALLLALAFCVCGCIFCPSLAAATESSDSTQTLTGTITEDLTIPNTVTTVVLSGVSATSDVTITCSGDVTLEIAAGTENTLGDFICVGNLTVTGSGTLYAQSILVVGSYGTFNHTGTIDMGPGMICATTGDLIINSGIIKTQASDTYEYGLLASSGNITINGGYLDIESEVSAIYAGQTLNLEGGSIDASSKSNAAILAGLDSGESSINVSATMDLGGLKVGYYTSEDGENSITTLSTASDEIPMQATLSGPSVTDTTDYTALVAAYAASTGTDTTGTDTSAAASEPGSAETTSGSTLSGTTLIIIAIVIIAAGTVLAAALITRTSMKKRS